MRAELDFYFFVAGTCSDLSVVRAEARAQAAGVRLVGHPFSIRTLVRVQDNSPFLGKHDRGQPDRLRSTLSGQRQDFARCRVGANSLVAREAYAAQTARARDFGMFGSPAFASGAELFWGDDRLDNALACAQAGNLARTA